MRSASCASRWQRMGSFSYDADAGINHQSGLGSHIALAKAVNGQELASTADAPEFVTYDVLTVDSESDDGNS